MLFYLLIVKFFVFDVFGISFQELIVILIALVCTRPENTKEVIQKIISITKTIKQNFYELKESVKTELDIYDE